MSLPRRGPASLLLLLLAASWLSLGIGTARAAEAAPAASVTDVATALADSPVYVEDGNEAGLTQDDAARLLGEVQGAGTPLYLAVVTKASLGTQTIAQYTHALGAAVGVKGTYGVVAGRVFYADSQTIPDAGPLATTSVKENKAGGANAILDAFVSGITTLAAGDPGTTDPGVTDPGTVTDPGVTDIGSTTGGAGALPWVLGLGVVGVGGIAVASAVSRSSSSRARITPEQLADLKTVVDEDVTEFGEKATALDATDVRLGDQGRADLASALAAYDTAKSKAEQIHQPADAAAVTSALEDGRYALACAQATLDGTPRPQRRPPCFMDPRHGPSVEDVTWTPPGGTARSVPVCQACAVTIKDGGSPAAREVPVGPSAQRVPYWQAGPQYGAYAGGYYSSFGNVLPAFLLGTMLGNAPQNVYIEQQAASGGWLGGGGNGGGMDSGGGGGWFGGGGGGFDGGGGGFDGGGGGGGDSGGGGGF